MCAFKISLLKDEYWAAEARAVEKCYMEEANILEEEKEETKEVQAFTDLIELWTAVSLYIDAGYKLVANLPEVQLRYVYFCCKPTINVNILSAFSSFG